MCDWTLTAGQFMPSNYWAMQVREGCITPEFLADCCLFCPTVPITTGNGTQYHFFWPVHHSFDLSCKVAGLVPECRMFKGGPSVGLTKCPFSVLAALWTLALWITM
ncbi:Uncharacterized protein HZ326_27418 [Fusarium oxysporum f. sp. albedinis]|nr:Uncharacterized protein HZ326_27418 [Fusarium oxysporum f. sp. albedinis]